MNTRLGAVQIRWAEDHLCALRLQEEDMILQSVHDVELDVPILRLREIGDGTGSHDALNIPKEVARFLLKNEATIGKQPFVPLRSKVLERPDRIASKDNSRHDQ